MGSAKMEELILKPSWLFKKRMASSSAGLLFPIQMPTDLSKYYIIKKYRHGWHMGSIIDQQTLFIPREHLVKIGYLSPTVTKEECLHPSSPPTMPTIIVVPISRQKRSQSFDRDQPTRADLDYDWRKSKPIIIPQKKQRFKPRSINDE